MRRWVSNTLIVVAIVALLGLTLVLGSRRTSPDETGFAGTDSSAACARASAAARRWLRGRRREARPSTIDPGRGRGQVLGRSTPPAERSASSVGRPLASSRPGKFSPPEWAAMNHGGTPPATSAPIIEPAEVPTSRSALAGSQESSSAMVARPPSVDRSAVTSVLRRSTPITRWPWSVSRAAAARPIPEPAPVTTYTRGAAVFSAISDMSAPS